jgi:quercetin dioxygenase-like cupin family protein
MTGKLLLTAVAVSGMSSLARPQAASPDGKVPPAPPPSLHSRPPVPFQFLSKAQIAQLMYRPGTTQSYVVTDHENYDIEYVTRALITDHIENHVHWLDYVTVLDGEGTLAYGGKPVDPDYSNASEPRGTKMTGATIVPLHPGDYVVVPAGVWHSFSGTPGHTLTYVIFKQRE